MNSRTGLAAARHAIAAAHCTAGQASTGALAWQDLVDWPDWALPGSADARDALVWRVAAWWNARALRGCIDGRVLQQIGRLIGEAALQQMMSARDSLPTGPGAATLPAADQLSSSWRDVGRALLLASLGRPALQDAVARHLDAGGDPWPLPEGIATPHAQALVARAQASFEGQQA